MNKLCFIDILWDLECHITIYSKLQNTFFSWEVKLGHFTSWLCLWLCFGWSAVWLVSWLLIVIVGRSVKQLTVLASSSSELSIIEFSLFYCLVAGSVFPVPWEQLSTQLLASDKREQGPLDLTSSSWKLIDNSNNYYVHYLYFLQLGITSVSHQWQNGTTTKTINLLLMEGNK